MYQKGNYFLIFFLTEVLLLFRHSFLQSSWPRIRKVILWKKLVMKSERNSAILQSIQMMLIVKIRISSLPIYTPFASRILISNYKTLPSELLTWRLTFRLVWIEIIAIWIFGTIVKTASKSYWNIVSFSVSIRLLCS